MIGSIMNLKAIFFTLVLTTTTLVNIPAIGQETSDNRISDNGTSDNGRSGQAASTTLTAYDLIDNLSQEILAAARASNNNNYRENIREILDDKYIERIDFLRITKTSTGAKAFNNASDDQQEALVREYSEYLIGLISTAAYNLPDYTIELIPTDSSKNKKKAEVGLKLKNTNTNAEIEAEFILHSLDGPWKIYDLNIAGTSAMIASKFFIKTSIEKSGIDGLIDELKKLNRATTPKPK